MKIKEVSSSIPSRYRLGLTLAIVIMVITSHILMLVSPTQVSAATSNRIDSSGYHSTPSIPAAATSPLSSPTPMVPAATNQGNGDFTAQAPLLGPATFRSTDLVSSTAIYEIQFFTTTTGVIDKIDVTFPAGTGVAFASILERTGITGPATVTKSGTTVTLDLNTPVNVPAGTLVRFEMVDISNPPNPANYKISVTTKNPSNEPIDGPSLSPAYTIRQVSTGMIANGAVTSGKLDSSSVTTTKLADLSVTTGKLDSSSVTNSKYATGSITSDKVASGTFGLPAAQRPGTVVNLDPGSGALISDASCFSGEQVIGGGNTVTGDLSDFHYIAGFIVGNSWRVFGENVGGEAMSFQSQAICALDFPL